MDKKVAVVTDSGACLPGDLTEELEIAVVPLHVEFPDGRVALESDLDFARYYEELVSADPGNSLPTTGPATKEQFVEAYEPLLEKGGDIVSVHMSSGLSRTCGEARKAAAELEERGGASGRIHILDAATAAGPMGLLVVAAAQLADRGGDIVDIVNRVRDANRESRHRFVLDTLEFLKRGGRIGGAAAWMGSTLKIKPILTVRSEITAVERVRTWDRAFERLLDFGRRLHASGADAWFVNYTHERESADRLVERLQEVFWRPPEFVAEIGPVIGTHTGPGMLGLGAIPPRFLE